MNNGAIRKMLQMKGVSPVGTLYILWTLTVPGVVSVRVKGNDGKEWEVTGDGPDYKMEKVQ